MAKKGTISALTTVAYSIVFVILAISAVVLVQIAAFGIGQRDEPITGLLVSSEGAQNNALNVVQYEDSVFTEITMQIKGVEVPDESGASGEVDYSSKRVNISVRTAQNQVWENNTTRPADIKVVTATEGSVSGEVGINEVFTLVLRTHQENNAAGELADYLIGGTCYIYAHTTDGVYVATPLAVNIDVPVESISVVVFDYREEDITDSVNAAENAQMFIKGDQLQLGITAIPSNSLNPVAGWVSKLADFRFTSGTNDKEATLTSAGLFTVTGETPSETGTCEIQAKISKHFGVSASTEKNYVESEKITIQTAPVELESILIGNTVVANNGITLYVGADGKLKLQALSGVANATALNLSLRSKHYTHGEDPLAEETSSLELEIVRNFTGDTDPTTNFVSLYQNAVVRNSHSVTGSNVVWEIEGYRPLVAGEKLQLRVKYPAFYESTYTLTEGKVIINGVEYEYLSDKLYTEPDFNGDGEEKGYSIAGTTLTITTGAYAGTYTIAGGKVLIGDVEYTHLSGKIYSEPDFNGKGAGLGYSISGTTVTVETGCIYLDLNVITINPTGFSYASQSSTMEITKSTDAITGEESLFQDSSIDVTGLAVPTGTNMTYTKWVYFKEVSSSNINAVGSDIIDLSAAGQLQMFEGTYNYSSRIYAKGGGEVKIRAYLVRTDASGNPLNYNYQPLTVDDNTGWMLESSEFNPATDLNKFVVVYRALSDHTVKITEKLTEIKFFADAALTEALQTSTENMFTIGTGVDNTKTIYARANSRFALLEYYKLTGLDIIIMEIQDAATGSELSTVECEDIIIKEETTVEGSTFYETVYLQLNITPTTEAEFKIIFTQEGYDKGTAYIKAKNVEITGVEVDFGGLNFKPLGGFYDVADGRVVIDGVEYLYDATANLLYQAGDEVIFEYQVTAGETVTVTVDGNAYLVTDNKVAIDGNIYVFINNKLYCQADLNGKAYAVINNSVKIFEGDYAGNYPLSDDNVTIGGVSYTYHSDTYKLSNSLGIEANFNGTGYTISTVGEVTTIVVNEGAKTLSVYQNEAGWFTDTAGSEIWALPTTVKYSVSEDDAARGLKPSFPVFNWEVYLVNQADIAGFASGTTPLDFSSLPSGNSYVIIDDNTLDFKSTPKVPADKVLILVYSADNGEGSTPTADWFALDLYYL